MRELDINDAGMRELLAYLVPCAGCSLVKSIKLTEYNTVEIKCFYMRKFEFALDEDAQAGKKIKCPFEERRQANPNFIMNLEMETDFIFKDKRTGRKI